VGPDHHRQRTFAFALRLLAQRANSASSSRTAKRHIDRRRSLVFVFDFRLGQGRTAIGTPMHRFKAFGQMTVGGDLAQ